MANVKGHIPKNLRIYSRKPETFTLSEMWGRGWWYQDKAEMVNKVVARKAFAVDRDSKGFNQTADSWSKAHPFLAPTLNRLQVLFEDDTELFEDVPNSPIKGLRIITLEIRGEGGRAYKVVSEEGYCYDLREDVILEAMIEAGIERGGILNGEYVWAVQGSQMKLTRVGSPLYRDLTKTTERRELKKISAKDLVPGGIYARPAGERGVFIGFARRHGSTDRYQVWFEFYEFHDEEEGLRTFHEYMVEKKMTHRINVVKNCSYVDKVGDMPLPPNLLAELGPRFRTSIIEYYTQWNQNYNNMGYISYTFKKYMGKTDCLNGTLVPDGQTPVVDSELAGIFALLQ